MLKEEKHTHTHGVKNDVQSLRCFSSLDSYSVKTAVLISFDAFVIFISLAMTSSSDECNWL